MSSSRRLFSLSFALRVFFLPLSFRIAAWFFPSFSSDLHPFFPALSSVLKKMCSSSRYIPKQHSNKLSWTQQQHILLLTQSICIKKRSYICRSWVGCVFFLHYQQNSLVMVLFFVKQRWMLFGFHSPYPVSHRLTHGSRERDGERVEKKFSIYVNVYNA